MIKQHTAQVERPVACAGKGYYIAIVHYGSPGGHLHHQVFKYSHKDPRQKDEGVVLRDIARMVATRYRRFIISISVVKRCLHPKSDQVARTDRTPHFERVFAWVVEHENSLRHQSEIALFRHLQSVPHGQHLQDVALPYTAHELVHLPIKRVVTTKYRPDTHASVTMRGVERVVAISDLLAA